MKAKAFFSNSNATVDLFYTDPEGTRRKKQFDSVSKMNNFCVEHNIEVAIADCHGID